MTLTSIAYRGRFRWQFDPVAFPDLAAVLGAGVGDGERGNAPAALTQSEAPLDGIPVHESRGAQVWRSRAGVRPAFFWKLFRARSVWDPVKALFRGSRAARAVRGGEALAGLGLEAPRVLAFAEDRRPWGVWHSILVTEAVELPSLERWAAAADLAAHERRRIVAEVARALARIHGGGLVHGDLRPSNVLLTREADRIVFLDNERTRRSASARERIRNLVQLGVDQVGRPLRTDRVRFIRAYARALGRSDEQAAVLLREVNAAIVARRSRRRNRGLEPLTGLRPASSPTTR